MLLTQTCFCNFREKLFPRAFAVRRYLSNLFDDRDPQGLQGYANYLVSNWNQRHGQDEKVEAFSIIFMEQITQPDLTVTPPERTVLYFQAY